MSRHRRIAPGDELTVARLDELAPSLEELGGRLRCLASRGVRLQFEGSLGPLSDIEARALTQGLLMAADFHAQVTAARLKAAVIRAREGGLFPTGRPRALNPQQVAELRAEGLGATAIAVRLGVARSSIYRKLKEIEAPEARRVKPKAISRKVRFPP